MRNKNQTLPALPGEVYSGTDSSTRFQHRIAGMEMEVSFVNKYYGMGWHFIQTFCYADPLVNS